MTACFRKGFLGDTSATLVSIHPLKKHHTTPFTVFPESSEALSTVRWSWCAASWAFISSWGFEVRWLLGIPNKRHASCIHWKPWGLNVCLVETSWSLALLDKNLQNCAGLLAVTKAAKSFKSHLLVQEFGRILSDELSSLLPSACFLTFSAKLPINAWTTRWPFRAPFCNFLCYLQVIGLGFWENLDVPLEVRING